MRRLDGIAARVEGLEAKQPRKETAFQNMIKKMPESELDRLEAILERTEDVDEFGPEERAFWDDLVARYDEDE